MCVPGISPALAAGFGTSAGEDLYSALSGSEKSDRQARNQTTTSTTSNTYNTYQYADNPSTTQRPNESLKISKEKTAPATNTKKSGSQFKEQLNIKPSQSINY